MRPAKNHVLAPIPGVWLMALVPAVQPTPGIEVNKPSYLVSLHTLCLSGAMYLTKQGPSCAAEGCGSSPCCSLRMR